MKAGLRIVVMIGLFGAVVALVLLNNGGSSVPSPSPKPRKRLVQAASVERVQHSRQIRFAGMARAVNHARLSFTIGERIVERPVEVGDHVEAGQVLARLDSRRLRNSVATVEAQLREIQARIEQVLRDQKRYRGLVAVNASAAVELEKINETRNVLLASQEAAKARLKEARRLVEEAVLCAPFPGTVTEVRLEPGEFANPGTPVVVLSGDGEVEIEVEVPESIVLDLRVGAAVLVDLPLANRKDLDGRIRYIGRTAMGSGRLFPVVINLPPESRVAPGMTSEVVFQTPVRSSLCVPIGAVVNPGGARPEVYRIRDGKVERVPIEVGEIVRDKILVTGPLEAGETVVVGGHLALLAGEEVEVDAHADR
ncbi:MAG: efflux RND transporter periplasmic adaptor subunit [Deltaproteobacteria bacterium]